MVKKKDSELAALDVIAEPETSTTSQDKILQLALSGIEKDFGKGSVMCGHGSIPGVEFWSSGCLGLNIALGGGYPKGRFIEIFGPESSGKTTLTLHAAKEMQKLGRKVAFIDAEHALDTSYATTLGVDMDKLMISQPNNGEECLEITERLVETGQLGLVIIDSVAALVPKAEVEGDMGDSFMGLQARMMGQAMRKLTGIAYRTNTAIIFINQIRMKIGVMFGSPETTTGGNALKFYASQRLEVRKIGSVKEGETLIANSTRVKVVKSKVSVPFKEVEFNIIYGQGIDIWSDLLRISTDMNIITKSGSWYSLDGTNIGQGEAKTSEYLKEHPEVAERILQAVQARGV